MKNTSRMSRRFLWLIELDHHSRMRHGGSLRWFNLSRELILRGHHVHFAINRQPGHELAGRRAYLEELRQELVALLPEGPLYFSQEQRTDLPVEVQIAELVREQALRLTKDELPHAITVEVQELGEKVIEADLLVETESQKQIVIGKGGSMVREIGRRARPEIEAVVGHPVYLELKVKVKPRWRRDEATLQRLGL